MARLLEMGNPINLPDVADYEYMLDMLFEIGPTTIGPDCELPLAWVDILAASQLMQVSLDPWESTTLRHMSVGYVAAKMHGAGLFSMSPMDQEANK